MNDDIKEIEHWCKKASNGYVLFDAGAGIRFASYCCVLVDTIKIFHKALKAIATPQEYKLVMQEVNQIEKENDNV